MSTAWNGRSARTGRDLRASSKALRTCLLCVIALSCVTAATAEERRLSGPQIRSAVSGKTVSDGRHWSHQYLADGRLERSENGRDRTGRWEVRGDRLCLLLPEVSKEEPICFDVVMTSGELQYRDERSVVYQGVARSHPPAPERLPTQRK